MNVQANTLVILFPCFISISRISTAPSLRINFFAGLTLSAFETRLVNQRFVGDSTFKTPMPENVTKGLGYARYIKSQRELVLSPEQVAEVREKMASGRLKASFATDQAHARYVRGLVAERYGNAPRRPSSGLLKLLVFPALMLGVGAIGVNAYSNFVSGAMAIGTTMPEQRVEGLPQPTPRQSHSEPKSELRIVAPEPSSGILAQGFGIITPEGGGERVFAAACLVADNK